MGKEVGGIRTGLISFREHFYKEANFRKSDIKNKIIRAATTTHKDYHCPLKAFIKYVEKYWPVK